MTIEVDHLWKTFQIPHERRTTLFENLTGFFRPNEFETYTVLKDISFRVEDGDCVGIIGDNGSGKSTLLKIIAHILAPTKGKVMVEGKITPFLELGVGFQPDLTSRENVEVYATIMGLSRRAIRGRIDDIIEFAGLQKFEDTKLKNLSSGMQVRLAFSTAVQTNPDILLVDEVLAVGDMEFQQKCFDVFNSFKRDGVTILFVSHDLGAVGRFCDKALLLRNGEIAEFGESSGIIERYLAPVNKPSQPAPSEPVEKKTRWGSGRMAITGIKFLDKAGRSRESFWSGEKMVVRIFFNAPEAVQSPIFGIQFYKNDVYCFGTNTDLRGYDTGKVLGAGHIDFEADRLPLQEGKFDVTVTVTEPGYKIDYDWHDRLYSFQVSNPTKDLGLMSMDARWRMYNHA